MNVKVLPGDILIRKHLGSLVAYKDMPSCAWDSSTGWYWMFIDDGTYLVVSTALDQRGCMLMYLLSSCGDCGWVYVSNSIGHFHL